VQTAPGFLARIGTVIRLNALHDEARYLQRNLTGELVDADRAAAADQSHRRHPRLIEHSAANRACPRDVNGRLSGQAQVSAGL
jgi:hypothetical protein